eukprot:2900026-Pleurochrysis_carterae.AAC.1
MDMSDILRDPIGCILLAAMFYVVPVATIMETTFYMGLRAISEVVLKVVVSATWRLSTVVQVEYKCVDGLCYVIRPSCRHSPIDEWNYTSHSQNDGNFANRYPTKRCARFWMLSP